MTEEQPYCEAQVGGMECGQPVAKWGQQCEKHDSIVFVIPPEMMMPNPHPYDIDPIKYA